jgi:6-phosphogluconate dehydrogenase
MGDTQAHRACEIDMVGPGVMGRNLVLNMAEHGFSVAGCSISNSKLRF